LFKSQNKIKNVNLLIANVVYTWHDADIVCGGCSASFS